MKTFPKRLNYALKKLDVSRTELAKGIGVTRQAIEYLCSTRQHSDKSSKYAFHIAKALGINADWLILGEGEMTSDSVYATRRSLF